MNIEFCEYIIQHSKFGQCTFLFVVEKMQFIRRCVLYDRQGDNFRLFPVYIDAFYNSLFYILLCLHDKESNLI